MYVCVCFVCFALQLTKVNRRVTSLAAEHARVAGKLSLAQEGYNDVEESIEVLQAQLDALNQEMSELQGRIAELTMMPAKKGLSQLSGHGNRTVRRIRAHHFGRTASHGQLLRASLE